MYSFNSRIRYSECGADGYLTIVALLNYFQDCSTFQSEDLGVGVAALHDRGTLWVVNSWQIDIMRLPRLCDRVGIYTRPYDCRGFFGKRNFYMKSEDGEYLAKADSLWTYISAKDATPVRIDRDILEAYGREPKIEDILVEDLWDTLHQLPDDFPLLTDTRFRELPPMVMSISAYQLQTIQNALA